MQKETMQPVAPPPFSEETMQLYKQACEGMGMDAETSLPIVTGMPEKHQKAIQAMAMLFTITEWINKRHDAAWFPNYHTGNQKWFTYQWIDADQSRPAGFGFSHAASLCGHTGTDVGSRLCFATEDLELAYRKQLEELNMAWKLMPQPVV